MVAQNILVGLSDDGVDAIKFLSKFGVDTAANLSFSSNPRISLILNAFDLINLDVSQSLEASSWFGFGSHFCTCFRSIGSSEHKLSVSVSHVSSLSLKLGLFIRVQFAIVSLSIAQLSFDENHTFFQFKSALITFEMIFFYFNFQLLNRVEFITKSHLMT